MYTLDCPFFAQPSAPEKALVMLHGYGANGHDLIGLAPMFRTAFPQTIILSPHAPNPCPMTAFGRQWFALDHYNPNQPDLEALALLAQAAVPTLEDFLQQVISIHQLSMKDVVLLGFSQGTMMALKTAATLKEAPAAIVGFSGAMPHANPPRDNLFSVLLVHGTTDSVVPFFASTVAHQQLEQWGINSQLVPREGLDHGIDPEGLQTAREFLQPYLA